MHTPVLLTEVTEDLQIKPEGLYIDATAGEGGHLGKIIELGGKVLAIDWDENQIKSLKEKFPGKNVQFAVGNYADIEEIAKSKLFYPVDGIVLDLGLSYKQLSESGRGFSYKKWEEPLDMRISEDLDETAADLLNSLDGEELYENIARYSEEIHSRVIADSIARSRRIKKFETVVDLLTAIDEGLNNCSQHGQHIQHKVYAPIFQALRIMVNHEFENIRKGLKGASEILKQNGRMAVITFHSLEDRIVKQVVRDLGLKMLHKKAIAGSKELSFERSAKLRVLEKV